MDLAGGAGSSRSQVAWAWDLRPTCAVGAGSMSPKGGESKKVGSPEGPESPSPSSRAQLCGRYWVHEFQWWGVQRSLCLLTHMTGPTCVIGDGSMSLRDRGTRSAQVAWLRSISPPRRTGPPHCRGWSAGQQTTVNIEDMAAH